MFSITKNGASFNLINDEEVIITSSLENLEALMGLQEQVESLAPELESFVHLDSESNCSCDGEGDIWVNPQWAIELAQNNNIPLDIILLIVLSHELGHAFMLWFELDASNEHAAWDIGEYLLRRIESPQEIFNLFFQFKEILLPTYKGDPKWKKWIKDKNKIVKEVISQL
jgi:hypothetical protein